MALFGFFFVRDAPLQVSSYRDAIEKLKEDNDKAVASLIEENKGLKARLDARNAKGLFTECHMGVPPSVMASSGRLYTLTIFAPEQSALLDERFGPPGGPFAWPKNGEAPLFAAQCSITNYSDEVLASISLLPSVMFMNTTATANGYQGQGVYRSTEGRVDVRKLDPGPSNSFVFYILNQSPDFVRVTMPTSAAAQRLGSQETITIPAKSDGYELSFVPFHASSPH
jgi:hypothetical protein